MPSPQVPAAGAPAAAPLGVAEVEALAPDAASLAAGRRLAIAAPWSGCGHDDRAAWGACKGSGPQAYQVAVDSWGPAFRCNCPSRKFPCKHALGLMLRWARGDTGIPAGSPPPEVAGWLAGRVARAPSRVAAEPAPHPQPRPAAEAGGAPPPGEAGGAGEEHAGGPGEEGAGGDRTEQPRDPVAAAARAARRESRVVAGMVELDRWLDDVVRQGIGQLQGRPYSFFDEMGARLVDAQAPGAAAAVRDLASLVRSGGDWPSLVLERLASLHLLARAWQRAGDLPGEIRADLRAASGWPEPAAEVLADPARRERGEWYVLARSVTEEERVRAQRTWLWELSTGRLGVLVDFARPGAAFAWDLWPGNVLSAEIARYPGSAPLRVLVAEQLAEPRVGGAPPAWSSLDAVAAARAAVLATDPWCPRWPLALAGAVVEGGSGRWALQDAEGGCAELEADDATGWTLLATAGGRPTTLLGEWEGRGVRPLGVWAEGRMVVL
jgi:hypothetical protein